MDKQSELTKALLLMVSQYLKLSGSVELLFHWHMTAGESAIDVLESLGYVEPATEVECWQFTNKAIQLMEQD